MRHTTTVSPISIRSLATALISVNPRTEVSRRPPHLPCFNPSRYVSCTNPCTKLAHDLQIWLFWPTLQSPARHVRLVTS